MLLSTPALRLMTPGPPRCLWSSVAHSMPAMTVETLAEPPQLKTLTGTMVTALATP